MSADHEQHTMGVKEGVTERLGCGRAWVVWAELTGAGPRSQRSLKMSFRGDDRTNVSTVPLASH